MKLLVKFFTSLNIFTKRLGICGNVGLIAGAIAGTLLMLLYLRQGGSLTMNTTEAVQVALMLTLFTWIFIQFVLVILARLTFRSVAIPSFVNCLLTCFAVVFIVRALGLYIAASFIGIVVGIIIGMLLCRINFIFNKLIKN
ncbi:MAG TPA: hypothetical protein VK151_11555 [Fluviicola sp.]|nr:hypothetical protein [Fluviicola sp.]